MVWAVAASHDGVSSPASRAVIRPLTTLVTARASSSGSVARGNEPSSRPLLITAANVARRAALAYWLSWSIPAAERASHEVSTDFCRSGRGSETTESW